MERDELRRQSYEAWEAMAGGWERALERIEASAGPVREWLVRELAPEPGQTILDLAAGPGETGFAAAALLGDEGLLVSSDRSPAMVEVGRRRAAALGLSNVEHRVLDAEELDLPDASVDGVICRFGYMLMIDPARALRETRRVLRPGGRLVFAVWREADRNPWVAVPGQMFVRHGLVPPPEPGAPGMFTLARDARILELLSDAGFDARLIEEIPVRFVHADVEEYVEQARETGGIFARAWEAASARDREEMSGELDEAFAPYRVEGRLELPGLAVAVSAA
jgi:ubiquinone/menaquinone biosynthesis C-methylase UbiE